MKVKKTAIKSAFYIYIFIALLGLSSFSQADNISITFWNLNMQMDDVNNYGGIRLVVFFLPTCPACISEMSVLKDLDENYNITIITLDPQYETSNQTLIDFRTAYTLPDDWIMGYSTDEASSKFNVTLVPSAVVLDDLGRVVALIEGSTSYEYFETKIDDAINYRTENYNPNFVIEPNDNDLLKVLFIVVGVGVSTVILYFLIQAIRRGSKESALIKATRRMEEEENSS